MNNDLRIILPQPVRALKAQHEANSATRAGRDHEPGTNAVTIFALEPPAENWNGVVLAVADGHGWVARGDLASTVAVGALEGGLTRWVGHLEFRSHTWQTPVAQALASAFEHANTSVRALLDRDRADPGQGVALTVAALFGDWLCVAHTGDCRVYRLSSHELQQLTSDHGRLLPGLSQTERPARALGLADYVNPAIRFYRLKPGDVVLVCSKALSRHLDAETLTRLLQSPRALVDIVKTLVTAAVTRDGVDDMGVCVARVGRLSTRLPAPVRRPTSEVTAEGATLLRYQARSGWGSSRLGVMLAVLALFGGLIGGWRPWRGGQHLPAAVVVVDTVFLPQVAPPVQAPKPAESAAPLPAPLDTAVATRTAEPVTADSLATLQRQLRDQRRRRVDDSLATARRALEDQRVRDSLTLVARRELVARQRLEAQARAADLDRVQRQAQARAEQEALAEATTAARVRETRLAAGRTELRGWLNGLMSSVNAGGAGGPILAAGPPGFAAFVDKNRPKLSEVRLLALSVSEDSGEAAAEWVAKWQTAFGTATSRRMKARATVVPDGDSWRLRDWQITQGAP